jgi:hypothetical protein
MPWKVYDYVHPTHGNLMRPWCERLQAREKAKLDFKVDALEEHGTELIPGMVAPTGTPSIFKLKVQGAVKLRPMLCEGPGEKISFTFLIGAKEVQWQYEPVDAPAIASGYRDDLIANPQRREAHGRSNPKT